MFLTSGAAVSAPLALSACGASAEDSRSAADDPDLLNTVLTHHLAVQALLKDIDETELLGPPDTDVLLEAREDSIAQLEAFVSESDGDAATEPAEGAQAESQAEALASQLEESIEASLEVVGELSAAAYRQAVHRYITEDAATLAAVRLQLGEDVAPDSFVFGAAAVDEEGS